MARADQRHLNDLPTNEFQPRVRGKDAALRHPMVFVERYEPLLDRHRHEPPPPPFYAVSKAGILSHGFA